MAAFDAGIYPATATIANGESLSGAVVIQNAAVVGIIMPAEWTAAPLTLQGSADGAAFADLYDPFGAEIVIAAAASRHIVIPPASLNGLAAIKLRSGTAGAAVNQGAARSITVVTRRVA